MRYNSIDLFSIWIFQTAYTNIAFKAKHLQNKVKHNVDKLSLKEFPKLTHSPDLAPTDYHLFKLENDI